MVILTKYKQRNKDTVVCKRHYFKRGVLERVDSSPIPEAYALESIANEKHVMHVNVEKLTDLEMKMI